MSLLHIKNIGGGGGGGRYTYMIYMGWGEMGSGASQQVC